MATIYKNEQARRKILRLYDERLQRCAPGHESRYVDTFAGKTHIVICGNPAGPPLVVLHGINAGAPMALEAMTALFPHFRLYAIDTVGQTTRSAETRLPVEDDSLGRWIAETMEQLGLERAHVVGISYGGFLLQKLMTHAGHRIDKAVLVVPGGLVDGPFWSSMQKLSWPLLRFLLTRSDKNLRRFLEAFYAEVDDDALRFQRNTLLGVKMDYRRPKHLQKADVAGFDRPVYGIFADTDVFFPGPEALERCQTLFRNFRGYHVLKNCKHIPDSRFYPEISEKIKTWLTD